MNLRHCASHFRRYVATFNHFLDFATVAVSALRSRSLSWAALRSRTSSRDVVTLQLIGNSVNTLYCLS